VTAVELDARPAAGRVPGEPGLWVVIFGDMALFGFLFLTYLGYRAEDAASFGRAQQALDTGIGAVYTLLLLTSSLLVVLGLQALRAGAAARARVWVLGAMACGLAFVVLKVLEYHAKVADGVTPQTSTFFLFYFFLTGLHLVHVVVGLGALAYLGVLAGRGGALADRPLTYAEGCACFWHMVDLLWIVLFPLLYLVR
jgi:nitric oxide reductase NorE protein